MQATTGNPSAPAPPKRAHRNARRAVEFAAPFMRIQILSDLHIEFAGNRIPPLKPDAELVILAGDLAPVHTRRVGDNAVRWTGADRILYVPGNHEYYGSEIDVARRELARQFLQHGVTLLDPGAVTVEHVRFIGATLCRTGILHRAPPHRGQDRQAGRRGRLRRHEPYAGHRRRPTNPRLQPRSLDDRECLSLHSRHLLARRPRLHPHRLRAGEYHPSAALRDRPHQGPRPGRETHDRTVAPKHPRRF